jgi:hypothetical protein
MNWFKKQIIDWALRQQERKRVELAYRGEQLQATTSSGRSDDIFYGCEQLKFTILSVGNGTLVRMDTHRPEDENTVRKGGPRRAAIFIVKDNETVQDAVVRLLGIAALERDHETT